MAPEGLSWKVIQTGMRMGAMQGSTVVAVTSGANVSFDRLRVLSELAELGSGREALLATTITGRPGSFMTFVDTATPPGTDLRITELRHRSAALHPPPALPSCHCMAGPLGCGRQL